MADEPMSDMVSVPAEKIAALREAVETLEQSDIFTSKQIVDAVAAFRAVVDAVETEAAPDELTAALASRNLARARQDEIADECDALRERIRALADEYTPTDERHNWPEHISNRVRALLGAPMSRRKLRIHMVQYNGDAQRFYYHDGTHSDWVPIRGHDLPGDKFHQPKDDPR